MSYTNIELADRIIGVDGTAPIPLSPELSGVFEDSYRTTANNAEAVTRIVQRATDAGRKTRVYGLFVYIIF